MSDEEERPFPESLCHRCAASRYVPGKTSVFIMCTALPVRYPPQPVRECPAYRPASSLKPSSRR